MKITPFKDTSEMVAAINSREYATDPEFREYVMARMAAGDPSHGGTETGNSGTLTFGEGRRSPGGISVKIGSEHRHAGGVARESIDPTAIYSGEGFESMHQLNEAFSDPRYAKDAAFRAKVAAAVEAMGPAYAFKI